MDVVKKYSVVFRCAVPKCTYSSQRLYNLQRHLKTHQKEHWRSKRFPCPCCAYAAATRAHLRRHMGKKHADLDISAQELTELAYEQFEESDKTEQELPEELSEKLPEAVAHQEHYKSEHYVEGPVTVLEMVTPLSPQSEPLPGETYCNVSLEGEAFRLIPVAMLPVDVATEEL